MKIGISYWAMKEGLAGTHSIEATITDAKEAGFDAIELCIAPEGVLNVASTQEECEAMRRQVAESGLALESVASGMSWGFNPTSDDPAVRAKAVELHQAALQRTAWLGCEALLFVPGVVRSPISPNESIPYAVAVERARDAVKQLLPVAEEVGVKLCLENVWNGFFLSPLEFAAFVDSFNSENLGIYFDVGNVLRYHQDPADWIRTLGDRIGRIHWKDFSETFDFEGRYSFCDIGDGDVPWAGVMEALREIGYDKTLIAEVMPYADGFLAKNCEAMKRIVNG